jgi:hypothetical protein
VDLMRHHAGFRARARTLLLCHARAGAPLPPPLVTAVLAFAAHAAAAEQFAGFLPGFVAEPCCAARTATGMCARKVQPPGMAWQPLRQPAAVDPQEGDDADALEHAWQLVPWRCARACEELAAMRRSAAAAIRGSAAAALRRLRRAEDPGYEAFAPQPQLPQWLRMEDSEDELEQGGGADDADDADDDSEAGWHNAAGSEEEEEEREFESESDSEEMWAPPQARMWR